MTDTGKASDDLEVASELTVRAIPGVPNIEPGDDLFETLASCIERVDATLVDGDVIVVASKIVSRAEGCFVDLSTIEPDEAATNLALELGKDPRLVELILRESVGISRKSESALIVRHRLGFVCANAGIDSSNATPASATKGSGPWVLTLPHDPNVSAAALRRQLAERFASELGVVITDSWGRPFRRGTVGFAIGAAGLPPVWDRRGAMDRHGRVLEATETAIADAIAAAADLVAGQANEGRPLCHLRGLRFKPTYETASLLLRDPANDLYA